LAKLALYPLSYGPPDLGPAGFEPATSIVTGCSSAGIRRKKGGATRGASGLTLSRGSGSNRLDTDVHPQAFAPGASGQALQHSWRAG